MSDLWGTPQTLFDKLDAEFHFNLDVCALPENAKCDKFFTPEINGLFQDWSGHTVWMNPPYGRGIEEWMEKAYFSDALVVALVPTRTNAPWWHDYVLRADEIRFIRKKVSFVGEKKGVAFTGHAVVVFSENGREPWETSPVVSSYSQEAA